MANQATSWALASDIGLIAYDLAKKLELSHVVYHSVFRVEHFKDVPHFASKFAIESAIREFDVPFTIIRPNYFFQNDASFKDSLTKMSVYPNPLGLVGISLHAKRTRFPLSIRAHGPRNGGRNCRIEPK
jgi:uncharacterized protein YbjT (DUF2867 family)